MDDGFELVGFSFQASSMSEIEQNTWVLAPLNRKLNENVRITKQTGVLFLRCNIALFFTQIVVDCSATEYCTRSRYAKPGLIISAERKQRAIVIVHKVTTYRHTWLTRIKDARI